MSTTRTSRCPRAVRGSLGRAERGSLGRPDSGFSLIEIMVAMAVLGFGLLGMLMLQAQAIDSSSQGREGSAGLAVARNLFEQMPRVPFSTLPADNTWKAPAWVQNPGLNPADPLLAAGVYGERTTDGSGTDHFQQLYRAWYRVNTDPNVPPDARVRQVEVEVIWAEDNDVTVTPATRTDERFVRLSGLLIDNGL